MHRGPNPDYQRAPVAPPRYGASAAPGAGPPFPGPFTRTGFPPHYPNPVSYPRSVPPPGFQSFSTEQSYQVRLINTLEPAQGCAVLPKARYDNRAAVSRFPVYQSYTDLYLYCRLYCHNTFSYCISHTVLSLYLCVRACVYRQQLPQHIFLQDGHYNRMSCRIWR